MSSAEPWTHHTTGVNGVRLHHVECGAGPPVVLLHGFPEFWYAWRHQIPTLAQAGHRVLAPDLRGYNDSDRPRGVAAYRPEVLVQDLAAFIEQVVGGPAAVVGHDWGGVLAWALAQRRPDLVSRLAVVNAPHPVAYRRELASPFQLARSWYVFFFQLPWLPEMLLRAGDFALITRGFTRHPTPAGAYSEEDLARYRAAFGKPGALTAMVNYYRAAFRYPLRGGLTRPVEAPTLLVWGEKDPYLAPTLAGGLGRLAPRHRVVRLPDVGHWVPSEAPARLNELLAGFLAEGGKGVNCGAARGPAGRASALPTGGPAGR